MSPIGSCNWTLGLQIVLFSGKVMKPLGGTALREVASLVPSFEVLHPGLTFGSLSLLLVCIWDMNSLLRVCGWDVTSLLCVCRWGVASLFSMCGWDVTSLLPVCGWDVNSLLHVCGWDVTSLLPVCGWHVTSLLPMCEWCVWIRCNPSLSWIIGLFHILATLFPPWDVAFPLEL